MKKNFKSFSVYRPTSSSKIIILCDHASNYIPKKYKNLGLKPLDVNKHIGWDIGALKVAKNVSKNINCSLIHSSFSRLLLDCNRSLKSKGAFLKKSEDIIIPGNKNISKKEKLLRAKKYYFPYHDQINKLINKKLNDKIVPILVSIHSFTPIYLGKSRPWHIGLLQRKDQRLSSIFAKEIKKNKKIILGINEPYKLDLAGDFTIPFFSESYGLPHVLIEIRQDLLLKNKSINFWSNLIFNILNKNFNNDKLNYCLKPSNKIKDYYLNKNKL
jgi:predicted N-formylglutamate amidohydrolase